MMFHTLARIIIYTKVLHKHKIKKMLKIGVYVYRIKKNISLQMSNLLVILIIILMVN